MPAQQADVAETIWYNEDSVPPLTVLKPAAFGPGQLLVAIHTAHTGILGDLTAPTGWAEEGSWTTGNGSTECHGKVFSHPYNEADPGSWDFPYPNAADVCLCLLRITDADLTPTIVVSSTPFSSMSASMDSPTVTPTAANDLLVCTLTHRCNGTAFSETDPSGMYDLGQTQVSDLYVALAASKELLASGGPTGVRTWTSVSPVSAITGGAFSIAITSSGMFDPDPPLNPPAAEIPKWLLWELLTAHQNTYTWGKDFPDLALDPSSPPVVRNASATTTTASFTPPAACGLVAFCHGDANDGSLNEQLTVTSTGGLTWSLVRRHNGADTGVGSTVEVWKAYAATSPGSITVSVTDNKGAVDKSLFVRVFTGVDPTVIGAFGVSAAATASYVTTAVNSWGWSAGVGGNAGTVGGATGCVIADSSTVGGFDGGDTIWTANQRVVTANNPGTTVATGTDGQLNQYIHHIAVEILPLGGAIATPVTPEPLVVSTSAPASNSRPTILRSSLVDVAVSTTATPQPLVVTTPAPPGTVAPVLERGTLQDDPVLTTAPPIVVSRSASAVPGTVVLSRGSLQDFATPRPIIVSNPAPPWTGQPTITRGSLADVAVVSGPITEPLIVSISAPAGVPQPLLERSTLVDDPQLTTPQPLVISSLARPVNSTVVLGRASLADAVVTPATTPAPLIVLQRAPAPQPPSVIVARSSLQDFATPVTPEPLVVSTPARMLLNPVTLQRSTLAVSPVLTTPPPLVVTQPGRGLLGGVLLQRGSLTDFVAPANALSFPAVIAGDTSVASVTAGYTSTPTTVGGITSTAVVAENRTSTPGVTGSRTSTPSASDG